MNNFQNLYAPYFLFLQIIFKKYLNLKQWISLILLTVGCMIKQINFNHMIADTPTAASTTTAVAAAAADHIQKNTAGFTLNINAFFILVQVVCSCLAGVYNEYLLKNQGADVNIYIQNVFMYLDSIVCNLLLLIIQGDLLDAFTGTQLQSIFRPQVILIMFNNAAIGIVTSFFLKYMNSILKTFASALELMFTAVLCYLLFAIPIYVNTVLAIAVVSFSIYLYSQSPVVNNNNKQQNDALVTLPQTYQEAKQLLSNDDDDEEINEV